jgi:DNA-binding Lrp family transcriptional regulator
MSFLTKSEVEQNQILFELYVNQKKSCTKVAKELECSYPTVLRRLRKFGIPRWGTKILNRKYEMDESFFKEINSHDKAQILGLIYSDGSIVEKPQYLLSIRLAENERDYLEDIKNKLKSNHKLLLSVSDNEKHQNIINLTICGENFVKNIVDKGCPQNKTLKIKFPSQEIIPSNFINSFILGLFEGDGCLSIYRNKKGEFVSNFSIVGTFDLCLGIQKNIKDNLGIEGRIKKKRVKNGKEVNYDTYVVGGNRQTFKIMEWLYQNNSFKMDRKYNKFLELKEIVERIDENHGDRYKSDGF